MLNKETVILNGNNLELRINEGRAQLKNYWVASIDKDSATRYSIVDFLKGKQFDEAGEGYKYVKMFKQLADGDYIVNCDKKGKGRMMLSVVNGVIEIC